MTTQHTRGQVQPGGIDLFTLYRHDRDNATDLPERVQLSLDIPAKVACAMCTRYPKLWEFVMDFIQEGNIQLLESHGACDPEWELERFRSYVAKSCKGAIQQYLSRTFDIYIPPTMRHRMLKSGEDAKLDWLEHHISWDVLFEHMVNIPDTNMHQAFNKGIEKKVADMLDRLPAKERTALALYYGIDTYEHSSQEIAKQFGCHRDHAKLLVNIAIKRLRGEEVTLPRSEWLAAKRAAYTQCSKGHPSNEENTYIDKNGKRHCRICSRERVRARYQPRKASA
jgi:RNA polymerase sigma factor (sigma-70 family)